MKNVRIKNTRLSWIVKAVFALVLWLGVWFFGALSSQKTGGMVGLNVSAAANEPITVVQYDIDMTIGKDRKIRVNEKIHIEVKQTGRIFTRSLPLEGDAYEILSLSSSLVDCTYDIYRANDYLNIDFCSPNYLNAGANCSYYVSYVMEIGVDDVKNGMQLDVVGYGWPFSLHNVTARIHFPAAVQSTALYSGRYGSSGNAENVTESWSADRKTLTLFAQDLETYYNSEYGETVAKGVTLRFVLPDGALSGFVFTRIFTDDLWWILLIGLAVTGVAALVFVRTRKKREIITVINVKAPDELDPLHMGKLLDGAVDKEDVTSMLYYFAEKGYLSIDLSDENDPVLIQKANALPPTAPVYQRTLFTGLFVSGPRVSVSALKEKFYAYADKAIKQLPSKEPYEKASKRGFIFGGVLGGLVAILIPLLLSVFKIGHGYVYLTSVALVIPIVGILVIERIRENYRYKWKKGKRTAFLWLEILLASVSTLIFTFVAAKHFTLEGERFFICVFTFLPVFLCSRVLTRTEKYCETLGQILGFKDFIVVTEEERIKFMLEENPELYYKILPYAQVLGVTDEWQNKFKGILLQPPTWCEGTTFTTFDYLVLHHVMRRAAWNMMMRPQPKGGGSFAGRSGGGGSFGGFGGGGHGGGGGGWR